MVVDKSQKPLYIFSREGGRSVLEGFHIGISHIHTLGADLASQELHSALKQGALLQLKLQVKFPEAGNHTL